MRRLLIVLLMSWGSSAWAAELRWGFARADGMPYVDEHEQQLHGGIIYELGQLASRELGFEAKFVETPNKRIDESMQSGRIHLICNNNRQWMANPDLYQWSAPLYSEKDVLLVHQGHAPINSLLDLHGKTLGTQLGYVYSPELMDAFANKKIKRNNLRELNAGANLLGKKRLEAVIGMHRTLRHQKDMHPDIPLRINSWVIDEYDMHCTYSPKLPVSAELMDKTLQQLGEQGTIKRLLND